MSSVVKTITPFLNKDLLLQALDAVGCKYTIRGDEILTDRVDYYGKQKFVLRNGRFVFLHDSSAENMRFGPHYPWGNIDLKEYKTVSGFLASLEQAYNTIYQKKLEELERLRQEALAAAECRRLEEERLRLEKERQEYVEKQRSTIIARAKENGYSVREEKVKDKIKLVLVRNTY
jgi:hypothetical protein